MESQVAVSDRFVDPAEVTRIIGIRPGMKIADIGAGSGAYALAFAEKVGEEGHVYAIDVQQDMLTRIMHEAEERNIHNIDVLWGDVERAHGSKLGNEAVDMVFLSNILFQFEIKEDALREVNRILKQGGTLVIVEWSDSFGGMGPHVADVVTAPAAKTMADAAGFALKQEFTPGQHHYGLIYTKVHTI